MSGFQTTSATISAVPTPPKAAGSSTARQRIKDGILALSLANLCFVGSWFSILFDADFGYFNKLRVTTGVLLALLTNLLGSALVFWLVVRCYRQAKPGWFRILMSLGFLGLLLIPGDFARRSILEIPGHQITSALRYWWVVLALMLAMMAVLRFHVHVVRAAAVVVGILSPLAFFTLGRIVLVLTGLSIIQQHAGDPPLAALTPGSETKPRVVWIVFDELDEGVAFDRRPNWVKLPEFDRLRAECLSVTNAYAPSSATLISLPALIMGRTVEAAKPVGPSELQVAFESGQGVFDWRQQPSIFSEARALGGNTGLVGWYHPYSRVLGASLNRCSWYPFPPYEPARAAGYAAALVRQFRCLMMWLHMRATFGEVCRRQLADAQGLVGDPRLNLVFLHLAPPHRPGVYLPEESRYVVLGVSRTSDYFNNLMLADHMLGELRRTMEQTGTRDRTWLLVSSDHWWREGPQKPGQPADHRVPFLLKSPASVKGETLPGLLNTVVTKELVLAILRGEIADVAEAGKWLMRHQAASVPQYRLDQRED